MTNIVDEINKLRMIGVTKINEKTLISHKFIQSILDRDTHKISRVKLNGLLQILEREYKLDLSALKKEHQEKENSIIFNKDEKNKNIHTTLIFYLAIVILIILVAIVGYSEYFVQAKQETHKEQEKVIVKKQQKTDQSESKPKSVDTTININSTITPKPKKVITPKVINTTKSIIINPLVEDSKLWFGVIDLVKGTKKHFTINDIFEIQLSGAMLLNFAHSEVIISMDKQDFRFREIGKLFFIYQNETLQKITHEEYLKYNKGKEW